MGRGPWKSVEEVLSTPAGDPAAQSFDFLDTPLGSIRFGERDRKKVEFAKKFKIDSRPSEFPPSHLCPRLFLFYNAVLHMLFFDPFYISIARAHFHLVSE